MRRLLLSFTLVFTAGCAGSPRADGDSQFVDTTGDGLPDARAVEGLSEPGPSEPGAADGRRFSDTDGDGLPDDRAGPRGDS